ncbi:beta-agarase [bacterium]|nr:MAG: beta-agarase [bacterium]
MPRIHRNLLLLVVASALLVPMQVALCDQLTPLVSPSNASHFALPLSTQQVKATGPGRINFDGQGLRLQIDNPYEDSGLEITPPQTQPSWDLSGWKTLAVDIENLSSDTQMRLLMEVAALPGAQSARRAKANVGIALNPGEKRILRLLLPHAWKFAPPEGVPGVRTLNTAQIAQIYFTMQWPFESAKKGLVNCRFTNLRAEEALTPSASLPADKYIPFIDQYGQFIHSDWPQKVRSAADLTQSYSKEQQQLEATKRPADWDTYGGWKNGPLLKATGSFRTEKYRGKWYLVDPEGRLFFSHGMDVINQGTEGLKVLPGKENWFQALPEGARTYNPTDFSLQQRYGKPDYLPDYFQDVTRRLPAWGMNSIGDWSSPNLMAIGKTPYTLQLTDYDQRMPKIAASKLKFYDVFDPAYIQKMKTLIPDHAVRNPLVVKSLTDPMCIGYFIDNELNFGNRGRMTLVDDILKSPAQQASKQEFVGDLKLKYVTPNKLNASWGTAYTDWNALSESTDVPSSAGYRADAQLFFEKVVEQYFRLSRDAVKSVAPNRLYLGARFISTDAVRPALYEASKKYADILSVNIYAHSAANFPTEKLPDMPVMITEFHFGLLQRGMFSASLCQAGASPEDRALAYTRFLQGALVHPNIVGTHWFQYRDQPLTGRGDGEAYQIGFVDITDTPYEELTHAARLIGENMYRYRLAGKLTNSMSAKQK